MKRILLALFFLGYLGTVFLGTRGTTALSTGLGMARFVNRPSGDEIRGERGSCVNAPVNPAKVVQPESGASSVGLMLDRAGEEEIVRSFAVCEDREQNKRS